MIPLHDEYKDWSEAFLPMMRWEISLRGTGPDGETIRISVPVLEVSDSENGVFRFKEELEIGIDSSGAYYQVTKTGEYFGSIFLEGRLLRKDGQDSVFEIVTSEEVVKDG